MKVLHVVEGMEKDSLSVCFSDASLQEDSGVNICVARDNTPSDDTLHADTKQQLD